MDKIYNVQPPSQTDTALGMFETACMYEKSAKLLNDFAPLGETNYPFFLTSPVLCALSLELYFKSLYFLEKNDHFKIKGRYSHDFLKLFDELDSKTKGAIETHYSLLLQNKDTSHLKLLEENTKRSIDSSFRKVLEMWSNIFVKARYAHDIGKDFPEFNSILFYELSASVKMFIFFRRPDWVSKYDLNYVVPVVNNKERK